MHGIGNDYIYFNGFEENVINPEQVAIKLSNRHFSIGGDGIVLILPSEKADFRMRMFNADGSEGKMCGNATRCIGKYVYEKGLTNKTELSLETLGGIKYLSLNVKNNVVESVAVNMGKPIIQSSEIPVVWNNDTVINEPYTVNGIDYHITCVSMGNPHCVVFINDINDVDIDKIGPVFENLSIFPDRVNTEFVQKIDDYTFAMRVWERGSGETMACGTGACATVVAAVLNGLAPRNKDITVKLLGGDLKINYTSEGYVRMTGPAAFAFNGEVDL
jgi:diaminopimelate epimerase